MSNVNVRPTTLPGVKSFAAQLRKEQGIRYSDALDIAARAANCTNFRNARSTLPLTGLTNKPLFVLLTAYWYDKKRHHQTGRETLRIDLRRPLFDTCSKFLLKSVRGFSNLRMVADDHFVCDSIASNQDYARDFLSTAERSLRFMERTGLYPSRDFRKGHPKGSLGISCLTRTTRPTGWMRERDR